MEFEAILAQVLYLSPQEGSVSYRGLKLRFQLKEALPGQEPQTNTDESGR